MAPQTPLLSHSASTPKNTCFSCSAISVFLSLTAIIISSTALLSFHFTHTNPSTYHALDPTSRLFLTNSITHISNTIKLAQDVQTRTNDLKQHSALSDCVDLMSSSIDRVIDSVAADRAQILDAHTWLSAVLTNHDTCLDGLRGSSRSAMESELEDLMARARASLAVISSTSSPKLMEPLKGGFPSWVNIRDRKLLLGSLRVDIKANVVVAKDGSGNYKTIGEAIASAPEKSSSRYVIYVKKGTYKENVEVGKNKKNVMIFGDGMDSTIITGSRNVVDGDTTFNSATLAATGDGFILQDIWVQNTAGPEKHQAVALRVGADQSVINRCRIDAYQDTLYAHSLRQFYRDCFITGTVDFIFGNAAVVLQNCKIVPRKPMKGQGNMVTAQGRIDPNQNTGTSIQKCEIVASADLEPVKNSYSSYLGRPWKEYSRTVVMESTIGDVINPAGWAEWNGGFALKTLYYGEYMNSGPGAGTSQRVKWPGYHVIKSADEAMKFTVGQLIQGGQWLKSTGVAFIEGL